MLPKFSKYFKTSIKFCSIDIGLKNLGIVWGLCDLDYKNIKFTTFELINLNEIKVEKKSGIQKYNHISDKLKTYFEKNIYLFNGCDIIFVEYQPLTGLRIIQEYIVQKFDEKVIFIHPQHVHEFFVIREYEYNDRKILLNNFVKYLGDSTSIIDINFYRKWKNLERKHDISDAICQVYYYLYQKNTKI
jgi:hypothetical protein